MKILNVFINKLQNTFVIYDNTEEIESNYIIGNIENIYLNLHQTNNYYIFEFYNYSKLEIYLLHLEVNCETTFSFINYILQLIYNNRRIDNLYIKISNDNFLFIILTDYSLNILPYFENKDKLFSILLGHGTDFYKTMYFILYNKISTLVFLYNIKDIIIMRRTSIITTKQISNSPISSINLLKYSFKDVSCKIDITNTKYKKFLQDHPEYQIEKNNINRAGYNLLLNTYPKLPIWE
ncbi:MAG: hypothetical protein ACOVNU_03160 [Candidatus Kapaibacteriota bacterium]